MIKYIKWLLAQLTGWNTVSYVLLWFGLGFNLALTITAPITPTSVITFIAGALGLTCTLAINNAKPVNGWLGLISALLFITIAFPAKNYMEVLMQCSYILLLDLPVLFLPSWNKNAESKISGMNNKQWIYTIIALIVVVIGLHTFLISFTDSPRPIIDAISAAIGILGSVLTTLKKRETYYFWITQGVMSMILWGITASQGGANWVLFVTYALYIANDIIAFADSPWFQHNTENKLPDYIKAFK